jgi:hypothetical protein
MDHETLKSRLYEFYDGEITQEESRIFSAHIASCGECRSEIEAWEAASEAIYKEAQVQVPDGFSEMVMVRIAEKAGAGRKPALASVFKILSLPRWEVLTAMSVSILIFSYFSIHFLRLEEGNGAHPIALMDSHAGQEQWLFSRREMMKDDLLQIALGNGGSDESEKEEQFYE